MSSDVSTIKILKSLVESDPRGVAVFSCQPIENNGHDVVPELSNGLFTTITDAINKGSSSIPEDIKQHIIPCYLSGDSKEFEVNLTTNGLFYQIRGKVVRSDELVICYLLDHQKVFDSPGFVMKMLENTHDLIAVVDSSHRFVLFNTPYQREIKQIYGVTLTPGMSLYEAVAESEKDYENALPAWKRAFEGYETRAEGTFGELRKEIYEYHFNPIKDEDGQIRSAVLTVRNIDRFRQLEEDSEDRSRLQHLLNQSPDIILKIDSSLTCQYVNGSVERFGISYGKIIGKSFHQLNISKMVRAKLMPFFESVFKGKRVEIFDSFCIRKKDYDLHVIFMPQINSDNEVESAIITCHDLTHLNTLKQKFKAIFDGTFQFIGLLDKTGKVMEANKAALNFAGIKIGDVADRYLWETPWFFKDDIPYLKDAVSRAAAGEFIRSNVSIKDTMGNTITIDFSLKPVRDDRGEIIWLLPEGRDISDLVRAEKKLEEIEEFTFMADNMPNMLWTATPDGKIQYVNKTFFKYTGLTEQDVSTGGLRDILHPEELEVVKEMWSGAIKNQTPLTLEHRIRNNSGSYCWYMTKINPMFDQDNNLIKWHGTAVDIDQLKGTSLALNNMIRHLQELTDAMPVIVWTADMKGVTDFFNKRWVDYTGLEVSESLEHGWKKIVHPDDLPDIQKVWNEKVKDREEFHLEYRLRGKNGLYRWFLEEGRPFFDEQGNLLKWVGTATDIQDQHEASKQLALKAEEFETMAETIPQVVWTANSSGELTFLSHKWHEWTGMNILEGLDNGWMRCIHEEDRQRVENKFRECQRKEVPFFSEFRLCDKHGNTFWVLGLGSPSTHNNLVNKWFGTFTDISVQKEVEEYKDAFLRIAGHELRTPLTSLMATLGLLRKLPANDPDFSDYLHKSYEASVKLKNLISDLLDISTNKNAVLAYRNEPFNFDNLIDDMFEHYQGTIKTHNFELRGHTGMTITADRMRIEQLFNNLVQNAVKYSPEGERILIERSVSDGHLIIHISDSGFGIDDGEKDLIFKKFYRADKHKNIRGMGLGLYMAQTIAENYGGEITVKDAQDKGSIFTVTLETN